MAEAEQLRLKKIQVMGTGHDAVFMTISSFCGVVYISQDLLRDKRSCTALVTRQVAKLISELIEDQIDGGPLLGDIKIALDGGSPGMFLPSAKRRAKKKTRSKK